jgi:hypothetical protein
MKHFHLSMRDLSQIVINEIRSGKSKEEAIRFLKQRGWPEASARQFVMNVLAEEAASRAASQQADAMQESEERTDVRLLWIIALIGIVLVGLNLMGVLALVR